MVTVTKRNMTLTIPNGAYPRYASAGWKKAGNSSKTKPAETKGEFVEPSIQEQEFEENPEVEDEELDEEYEEVDPEELALRPLEELDKEELIILAEYKGLETQGLSAKKLRESLRSLE